MCPWKTTRTLCAVLLLVPLLHLAVLKSTETMALLDGSPAAWQSEIDAYNAAIVIERLPVDPVVVVGGRLVQLWPGLEAALDPLPVLRRGLGDATVDDIRYHYESLVGVYRPATVVLLPGSSEFQIRDNKSADELFDSIRELAEVDAAHGRTSVFYVFAPLHTPRYPGDQHKIRQVTARLVHWAGTRDGVEVIDPNPLLADRSGGPDPRWFRGNGVHLNDGGFLRLSLLLQHALLHRQPGDTTLAASQPH